MKKVIQFVRENKAAARVSAAFGVLSFAGSARAAGEFDVTSVITIITAVGVGVGLIGAAMLVVTASAKGWKKIGSAM